MTAATPPPRALQGRGLQKLVEIPATDPPGRVEFEGQGQRIFLLLRPQLMQRFAATAKEKSRA